MRAENSISQKNVFDDFSFNVTTPSSRGVKATECSDPGVFLCLRNDKALHSLYPDV